MPPTMPPTPERQCHQRAVTPLIETYVRGLCCRPFAQAAYANIAPLSYDEIGALIDADAGTGGSKAAVAAARIGEVLGATNMKNDATGGELRSLLDDRRRDDDDFRMLGELLFDHVVTFKRGRRVIGILARPYSPP